MSLSLFCNPRMTNLPGVERLENYSKNAANPRKKGNLAKNEKGLKSEFSERSSYCYLGRYSAAESVQYSYTFEVKVLTLHTEIWKFLLAR
jgi:hypothetical protein